MSPEQARGEKIDGRTDLYATGIILWELLTGRQLFPSGRNRARPRISTPPRSSCGGCGTLNWSAPSKRAGRVPVELDRITLKALAPNLKDRYPTARSCATTWPSFWPRRRPAWTPPGWRSSSPSSTTRTSPPSGPSASSSSSRPASGTPARGRPAAAAGTGKTPGHHDGIRRPTRASDAGRATGPSARSARRSLSIPIQAGRARDKRLTIPDEEKFDSRPATRIRRFGLRLGLGDRRGQRDRGALLRAAPPAARGHGARLRGGAHRHRPPRRAQDLAPRLQPDARSGRAAAARGARRLEDLAPQRRRRDRLGDHAPTARSSSSWSTSRGSSSASSSTARGSWTSRARCTSARRSAARHPGGARGERHPPRHQAGERPHLDPRRAEGLRQGARLRDRQERQGQRPREREGHQRRSCGGASPTRG